MFEQFERKYMFQSIIFGISVRFGGYSSRSYIPLNNKFFFHVDFTETWDSPVEHDLAHFWRLAREVKTWWLKLNGSGTPRWKWSYRSASKLFQVYYLWNLQLTTYLYRGWFYPFLFSDNVIIFFPLSFSEGEPGSLGMAFFCEALRILSAKI